ncbi:hypothetical protein F0562_016396 [Nyssa sinensis]|uniref:Uncharacterized protein n=1 Tax=Nyssa sinensis TaxID=561372 RepID=A0A5J4ZJH2_9ASTE|nr:hypothetical protein F0562_016396 [Nyssa sinensis]
MEDPSSTEAIIMATLSTLTPPQISDLTHSISSLFLRHHGRLCTLLSSPTTFSLTLHRLRSLSLPHKSLLIARHLLSTLSHLTRFLNTSTTPPSHAATAIKLGDLDAVLLLLLLCELRQHDPEALKTSPSKWRSILCNYVSHIMLTLSGMGVSNGAVLIQYIEVVARCRRFVGVMGCGGDGGGKERRSVAASVAEVVALPSVEVSGVGREETRVLVAGIGFRPTTYSARSNGCGMFWSRLAMVAIICTENVRDYLIIRCGKMNGYDTVL